MKIRVIKFNITTASLINFSIMRRSFVLYLPLS
jgi:hypothetical protein